MSNIMTGLAMVVALGAGDGAIDGWSSVGQTFGGASPSATAGSPVGASGGQASGGVAASAFGGAFGGGGSSRRLSSAAVSAPSDWARAPENEIGRPALPDESPSIIDRILGGGSDSGAPGGSAGPGGGGRC